MARSSINQLPISRGSAESESFGKFALRMGIRRKPGVDTQVKRRYNKRVRARTRSELRKPEET